MKKLILYFIILLISVWLGIKIHANPGYVLISYQHWSIETSLWFALLALVLTLIVLYIVFQILHALFGVPNKWHGWAGRRRRQKARKLTNRGLCELAEGNFKVAEKYLIRAAQFSETPVINYLAAASSAQGQQAFEQRDNYLRLAYDCTAGAEEVAVGLTQAQLQLGSKQLEHALATLRHLNQIRPHHAYVLKLLKNLYQELRDWEELKQLTPELRKYRVFPETELAQIEQETYSGLLINAAKSKQTETLHTLWENMPKSQRKNPELISIYTDYLIKNGESTNAEEILRDALKKSWSAQLIKRYGMAQGRDPNKQLAAAEQWLKIHGQDSHLLLALGRICVRNQLWGKAKNYLEASTKQDACVEAYYELGKVLEKTGDAQTALTCYRQGLSIEGHE